MHLHIPESLLDKIIEENCIKVDLTELVFKGENVRVYKTKVDFPAEVYSLDTPESRSIACRPEIVGEKFLELNRRAAIKALKALFSIIKVQEPIVLLHILRASKGYMVHEALKHLGKSFAEAYVRVKYEEGSIRDHVERKPKVVYRDYSSVPGNNIALLLADTVATGLSAVEALKDFVSSSSSTVSQLILYGFISEKGVKKIVEYAKEVGVEEIYVFALQDLTPLAYNNYDMPLYGPDESWWSERHELKCLGAVVDIEVLREMLPYYAPGADQPGDWSERQPRLFNGYDYEPGDIKGHLEKSLHMLEKLLEISRKASWFTKEIEEIYKERMKCIRDVLRTI